MNLKSYLTYARVGLFAAATFAAVLGVSWIAGQCRQWRTPPAPKPLPPIVDPGTPTPGRTNEAPTIKESLTVARPEITRKELEAAAKKYGLELVPLIPSESTRVLSEKQVQKADKTERLQSDASPDVSPQTFPMLLAEESFKHHPSGADVDVSAWLHGFGERVDLRAQWRTWTPPAPPKMPVCQSGSFFANEAKWVKEVGVGYVYGGDKAGLGGWGSLAYRGPRTGAVTWGGRAFGAFSNESGAVGVGGFTASW